METTSLNNNNTPLLAVQPDKENAAAEPSFHASSITKKGLGGGGILQARSSQGKNTATSSSSSNNKGGKVVVNKPAPIVIKQQHREVPAVAPKNPHVPTAVVPFASAPVASIPNSNVQQDGEAGAPTGAETMVVDWKAESKELDEMFDDQNRTKFRNVPMMDQPPKELLVKLFPHQLDGVSWMVHQETKAKEAAIPPFFIRKPNGKYRCTLTCNRTQDQPPAPVRGGILADDMGLGKTVQSIALILANPPPSFQKSKKGKKLKIKAMPRVSAGPRCTLIVCPLMPMAHWKNEIATMVKKKHLKMAVFHGTNRQVALNKVEAGSVDVLLTTYDTLASHFTNFKDFLAKAEEKAEKKAAAAAMDSDADDDDSDDDDSDDERDPFLFELDFYRIILDEAQQIRNKNTKSYKAVMAVSAENHWCLTGTPIVNKPDDIQPYFEYLGFEPFNDKNIYERYVTDLIKQKKGVGLRRLRTAVSFCTLRRSKDQVKTATKLPRKIVLQTKVPFGNEDDVHATAYEKLYETTRSIFSKQLNQEEGSRSIKDVWPLLIRLKQACCHAELVPSLVRERAALAYEIRNESDDPSRMLAIMKPADDDKDDAGGDSATNKKSRNKLTIDDNVDPRSPKVEALLKSIKEMKPNEKGVIFSQFTSFLNILELALDAENHTWTRIDGTMDSNKRQTAMQQFSADACDSPETPRFILCSLKAAGVGITLTRANHVFMMDPWWNTSIENQAFDRVYRIGQTRPVRVVRFVMADSIEERLVAIQEAKQALGNGSLQKLSKEEQEKVKLTTIKDLFEISEDDNDEDWDWLV